VAHSRWNKVEQRQISNLVQMNRLTLDETDDHPDPHGQVFEVQGGMKRVELGVNLAGPRSGVG
jgi:hypothetical protein